MVTILFTNCAMTVKPDVNCWTYGSLINKLEKCIGKTDLLDPVLQVNCTHIKSLTHKLIDQNCLVSEKQRKCKY